jgi:hypothetical protein
VRASVVPGFYPTLALEEEFKGQTKSNCWEELTGIFLNIPEMKKSF